MNNEIPKEVFYRKQTKVEKKIAEVERLLIQYRDIKETSDNDVADELKNLKKLLEQGLVLENGEFTEVDIDKHVYGVRSYEVYFEWILSLKIGAGGEYDENRY